jgi:GNAT superfamily N-acetyltransferase
VPDAYEIRKVRTRADREAYARIALEVAPEHARTVEEAEYYERLEGGARLVVWHSAEAVACAGTGRLMQYAPGFDAWWAELLVLEGQRGRGLGSGLYSRLSTCAAAAGKRAFHVVVSVENSQGIGWLERRGFREWERSRRVYLDLATIAMPPQKSPAGVEIVPLAGHRELLPAVHAVADEAFRDIPGNDEVHTPGSYEEWLARGVDAPGIPADGFFVALVDGQVAGYASLEVIAAHPRIAWHDMTAVARAYRRRGIAIALKHSTIAWAKGAGFERLQTENDVGNASMRAVNARLGYRPMPDEISLRGALAPALRR